MHLCRSELLGTPRNSNVGWVGGEKSSMVPPRARSIAGARQARPSFHSCEEKKVIERETAGKKG